MPGEEATRPDLQTPSVSSDEAEARAALVLGLRQRGIRSRDVLSAIELLPRRLFLSARHHPLAYEDVMLPIECGQTVSAPSLVAMVVQALNLSKDHLVLEIGTGSGYQTAVLAHMAGRVESIDRYRTLVELATQRLAALKVGNVRLHLGDGLAGLANRGPFDRIVANAAVETIPDAWIRQLKPGGVIVAPIGAPRSPQTLKRIEFGEKGPVEELLQTVRTITMQTGTAAKL